MTMYRFGKLCIVSIYLLLLLASVSYTSPIWRRVQHTFDRLLGETAFTHSLPIFEHSTCPTKALKIPTMCPSTIERDFCDQFFSQFVCNTQQYRWLRLEINISNCEDTFLLLDYSPHCFDESNHVARKMIVQCIENYLDDYLRFDNSAYLDQHQCDQQKPPSHLWPHSCTYLQPVQGMLKTTPLCNWNMSQEMDEETFAEHNVHCYSPPKADWLPDFPLLLCVASPLPTDQYIPDTPLPQVKLAYYYRALQNHAARFSNRSYEARPYKRYDVHILDDLELRIETFNRLVQQFNRTGHAVPLIIAQAYLSSYRIPEMCMYIDQGYTLLCGMLRNLARILRYPTREVEDRYFEIILREMSEMPIPLLLEYLLERKRNKDLTMMQRSTLIAPGATLRCPRVRLNVSAADSFYQWGDTMWRYKGLHCSPFQPFEFSRCNDSNWDRYREIFYDHDLYGKIIN